MDPMRNRWIAKIQQLDVAILSLDETKRICNQESAKVIRMCQNSGFCFILKVITSIKKVHHMRQSSPKVSAASAERTSLFFSNSQVKHNRTFHVEASSSVVIKALKAHLVGTETLHVQKSFWEIQMNAQTALVCLLSQC